MDLVWKLILLFFGLKMLFVLLWILLFGGRLIAELWSPLRFSRLHKKKDKVLFKVRL